MICVDPLVKWGGGGGGTPLSRGKTCHLFTTDVDPTGLHEFARVIGLRRSWFQDEHYPHYDLVKSFRKKAVEYGAVEVSRTFIVRHYRRRGMRYGKPKRL